ncbi:MAG TPA: PilZ domain-containing protein [Tepidisphaeraceae bacterium]|jgi:c-di-GMP-binding flagellar brake protein YcgR|nr:PilZ domain-containing protein [Tepidisphaeraceae bacterium]
MADNKNQILHDAVARNSAIVLSLPSAGMLRHHKSRFLAEDESGFWVEAIVSDRPLIDELLATKSPVGVSFKAGPQKVSFATPILERSSEFRMNAQTVVEAIRLGYPTEVKAIQRRNNYRVHVPEGTELRVRVWRVPEHFFITDKPQSAQELALQVRDLSTGGIGVTLLAKNDEPPKVVAGERLRISLRYKELDEFIVEGRVKFLPQPPLVPPVRCGIQFKKLENDLEGRQILASLTGIVGELQREEVRRTRLGIKAA